ncbi:molybdenum cofactor guanylyltransferase [Acetobacter sp. LMG 32666]|uniref:molybdenum cofactor guanylyltransferase n=1 Tax=Acetobacter sp. LMG 32666 TaxID=2959295 RepID=UPI0030C83FE0
MQHTIKIAGLVLAGGQGRRMHYADKAFMEVDHRPCMDWVIASLKKQCAGIAISANGDAQRFNAWDYPVLADTQHNVGPLAGLLSGLEWAEAAGFDALLSVPVDTPFIPDNLVRALLPAPSYAVYAEQRHSLIALWPVAPARALLAAQLAGITEQNQKQKTRVCTLASALNARAVDFAPLFSVDPFLNINTPEDLAEVRTLEHILARSDYRGT